jgi:F420-dependent oxidoreductase-like protein
MEGMGLGDAPAPMLEAYTTLGFLAAHTSTVELQALVNGVTYRHPGLLAKIATTLDVLSGGRAMLGIGAAWYEREHLGLGVPFPPLSERFERLEETLQIVLQMWSDDDGPYEGAHYRLAETICSPPPLTPPHPPIMIGGSGEKKTLRLVAKYADACNFFAGPNTGSDAVKAKLDVLAVHCANEGTDMARIRKTILWTAPVDPTTVTGAADFVEQMKGYADVGIVEVRVMPLNNPIDFIRGLGQHVVPAIGRL